MPAPYSVDLRSRAVWQRLIFGFSFVLIASEIFISERSARRYYSYWQNDDDLYPKKRSGIRPDAYFQFTEAEIEYVLQLVADDPCATLEEYVQRYITETGRPMTIRVFLETLSRLKITRKKTTKLFLERDFEKRFELCQQCMTYEWSTRPHLRVFFDESATDDRRFQQLYGRALRGKRAFARGINFRGKRYSMLLYSSTFCFISFVTALLR
jgi:transposase